MQKIITHFTLNRSSYLIYMLIAALFFSSTDSYAKRKKKFKGVVIVNQILKLKGEMTNNGSPAPEFSGVKEGDVLETASGSAAVIRIPGLLALRMGEKTKIKLTRFSNRDKSRIDVLSGDVLFLLKRLGDHEFITPHGVVIPQGGSSQVFALQSRAGEKGDDGKDVLELWEGKLQVKGSIKSLSPQPSKTPELLEAKRSEAPAGANIAVESPAKTPSMETEIKFLPETSLASNKELKRLVLLSQGIDPNSSTTSSSTLNMPLVQELESLYALP